MASIREVAKRAGVATCTVSRVLNGTAPVSEQTRKKIEQAMQELDYVPNELARGMFRQKAGIVAMLVPSIRHPFFSSLAESIERDLYRHGYKLMLCSTSNEIEREKEYLKFLKSNIVDGLILAVNSLDAKDYQGLNKPVVMLDYYVDEQTPVVVSDHWQGGLLAAEEFIRNHCTYVLHLCADRPADNVISYKSHEALEQTLRAHGIKTRAVEIFWNFLDLGEYEELARSVFQHYPEIDGVMCADMPAVAFLNAALSLGKEVPRDVAIVAYDGTYVVNMSNRHLTTIVQPIAQIAERVVDILVKKIDNQPVPEVHVRLPLHIERGDTT